MHLCALPSFISSTETHIFLGVCTLALDTPLWSCPVTSPFPPFCPRIPFFEAIFVPTSLSNTDLLPFRNPLRKFISLLFSLPRTRCRPPRNLFFFVFSPPFRSDSPLEPPPRNPAENLFLWVFSSSLSRRIRPRGAFGPSTTCSSTHNCVASTQPQQVSERRHGGTKHNGGMAPRGDMGSVGRRRRACHVSEWQVLTWRWVLDGSLGRGGA